MDDDLPGMWEESDLDFGSWIADTQTSRANGAARLKAAWLRAEHAYDIADRIGQSAAIEAAGDAADIARHAYDAARDIHEGPE
jgi:hypothetical protein